MFLSYAGDNESPDKKAGAEGGGGSEVAQSLGNSNMWTSCLGLLTQLQTQSKLAKKLDDEHLKKYMVVINVSLKHPTPSVRRAAEELFFTLYEDFGQSLEA